MSLNETRFHLSCGIRYFGVNRVRVIVRKKRSTLPSLASVTGIMFHIYCGSSVKVIPKTSLVETDQLRCWSQVGRQFEKSSLQANRQDTIVKNWHKTKKSNRDSEGRATRIVSNKREICIRPERMLNLPTKSCRLRKTCLTRRLDQVVLLLVRIQRWAKLEPRYELRREVV